MSHNDNDSIARRKGTELTMSHNDNDSIAEREQN